MPIAHIYNGELGFDVRTKLNALIDQVAAIPTGGGTGDVTGPAGSMADAVAVYDGVTGKLIKDGGQTIANIIAAAVSASGTGDVVGPASAVNSQIAVFNGVTGKLIADGGQTIAAVIAAAIAGSGTGDVVGPASAITDRIATYNGVTGKLIADGGMTIADVIAAGGGGSGTTILDGSGAPSSGTGAAGDYYVDNDDNIMYGPKAAIGTFGPDQIAIPPAATPAASGSGSYEVGARVVAAVAGEIYAVRYWRYTTTTQIARTVNVWTTGGVLLSSGSVANDGGGSGWKQITLTTPVAMAASGVVFVSVDITNTYGETSSPGFPLSNGGDISITTGSYSTTPGTFPGTTFGNNFFVDAVFHVPVPTWPPAVDGDAVGIGSPVGGGTSGSILYVDSSSSLAQQNANLYFDDANNALKIGSNHTYNIDTFRALYRVPNVAGDNWFEGDAGNPFVTGHENFGTGSQCMLSLTTGSGNTGIGSGSMLGLLSGNFNFAFGTYALRTTQTGSNNLAVGPSAMQSGTNLTSNIGLGQNSLQNLGTAGGSGTANMGIGVNSLSAMTNGTGHIGIGASAGGAITTDAGFNANVLIGYQALSAAAGTNYQNTAVGAYAGSSITNLLASTIVGVWPGPSSALSNIIAINDGAGTYFSTNAPALDWNYTNNGIWSFHRKTTAQGLHVYNTFDDVVPTVNYERGIFDWRVAANVLTIGTQAGGTGTLRPVNIIGSALTFNGSPIGGGGGMAIGGAVTGGTAGSILYVDSGNLAQQNANLFFDDANNALKIGSNHTYNIDTFRALYRVPHASGDNWFEGDAGNLGVTGYENFGTGGECMMSLTTGTGNTGIGHGALRNLTTGGANFAFGKDALRALTTGSNNVGVGPNALQSGTATQNNVGIGSLGVMQNLGNPFSGGAAEAYNVAIGAGSFQSLIVANQNTALGALIGTNITVGDGNTMIGFGSGNNIYGGAYYDNTFIGKYSGGSLSGAQNCTVIGEWAGPGASLSNIIVINDGRPFVAAPRMDFNYTNAGFWSMDRGLGLALQGSTSGTVKIITKAVAGTWTLTLPDSAGTSGYVLSTDGAGVTSWAAAGGGGGMAIGGAITSATAGSVLFAGVGGVLAQDNTRFYWDDASDFLKVGNAGSVGAYYLNNLPALYTVPNVGGNNWFEGNAGNTACTGHANFATGDQAMQAVTTGSVNIAVGNLALTGLTTGSFNVAFGYDAMSNVTTGSGNFASGGNALKLCTTGNANTAFGGGALQRTNGDNNVAIGVLCLNNLGTENFTTGIGYAAGYNQLTGNHNVYIGYSAGGAITTGGINCMIGDLAGSSITSGDNNLLIGNWSGPAAAASNLLALSTGGGGGAGILRIDWNYTKAWTWSLPCNGWPYVPSGLHIYGVQDAAIPVNYERGVFDWNVAANVLTIGTQAGGTGTLRLTAFIGYPKAGAPAAGDLPSGSFAVIDDTSAGQTWLVFNKAGVIRKVELV